MTTLNFEDFSEDKIDEPNLLSDDKSRGLYLKLLQLMSDLMSVEPASALVARTRNFIWLNQCNNKIDREKLFAHKES